MNGRVYDPELGKFLSADPHVQFEANLQSYNRYAYVHNNPLKYTDPTGYFVYKAVKSHHDSHHELLRSTPPKVATIVSLALNFVPGCQGWCSATFNAAYAGANGGSTFDIGFSFAVGLMGSALGGNTAASIGVSGFYGNLITGAIAGSFTGGVNASITGGKISRGIVQGAISGAVMSAVMYGMRMSTVNRVTHRPPDYGLPDIEVVYDIRLNPAFRGHFAGPVTSLTIDGANQAGAKVNFNYKTDGLEKFAQANKEFDVGKLFEGVLPEGTHDINVSIDPSIDSFMRTSNASTILVNPDVLSSSSLNVVGSAIGHELVHVNDYLRGNINVFSSASVRASEVRAYGWQFKNARHFGLSREYKSWLTNQIREHR
jgi:hypothetical protein